jgi:hypothetical protein
MPAAKRKLQFDPAIPPEEIDRYLKLYDERATLLTRRAQKRAVQFHDDPVGWAAEHFTWPKDQFLSPYQQEILNALVEHRRVAVRGPHGLGKTAMAAITILWFAIRSQSLPRSGGSFSSTCGPKSTSGPVDCGGIRSAGHRSPAAPSCCT